MKEDSLRILKVGLLGASGRVGCILSKLLTDNNGLIIHQGKNNHSYRCVLGQALTRSDVVSHQFQNDMDVWIDFSSPIGTIALIEHIKAPLVIGTTGFSDEENKKIEMYSRSYPTLKASNFSPGLNWLRYVLSSSLPLFPYKPDEYSVYIEDEHHKGKLDSPSGTALNLKKIVSETKKDISVISIRAGELKGSHRIRLISDHEEIFLYHRVEDRTPYALGAIKAAVFLVACCSNIQPLKLFSMEDYFHNQ